MKTITLDVGGTALKSAVYEDGKLYDSKEISTEASLGGSHVVDLIIQTIRSYEQNYKFRHIGISTAGQVNPIDGSIIYANKNIPGYTGIRLKDIVEQQFHVPVAVENDVNSAAVGEAFFGAGRNEQNFVCLTYGTGIGGALFLNGSLHHGSSFSAGEFGAIITHPEERNPEQDFFSGCYEKYASASALVRRAVKLDASLDNGRTIFSKIEIPEIKAIIDDWITEIVYGLVTITHMMNPSCIILGGGVLEQPYLLAEIRRKLHTQIMPSFRHVQVKRAQLGNQAGLLGAAVLARGEGSKAAQG